MKETKSATIIDVAALAGVSKATVGRVIGNYGNVSPRTRTRVLSAIEELGYSQNAIAQGLRAKSTKTIGVIVADITNNFCNRLLKAVELVALQRGYDVLFGNSGEDPTREFELLANLKARRVDGIVLISCITDARSIPKRYVDLYHSLPIVLADRRVRDLDLDLITSDNEARAYSETKKLIGLGHRKIGVIFFSSVSTIADRYAGYQNAMREAGLEAGSRTTLSTQVISGITPDRIAHFLSDNPDMTAVMVFNNSILASLLRAMRNTGKAIGRDLSIISWDDDDLNDLMEIDTVTQKVDVIGQTAVDRLFSRIEGDMSGEDAIAFTLGTAYIKRASCQPPCIT